MHASWPIIGLRGRLPNVRLVLRTPDARGVGLLLPPIFTWRMLRRNAARSGMARFARTGALVSASTNSTSPRNVGSSAGACVPTSAPASAAESTRWIGTRGMSCIERLDAQRLADRVEVVRVRLGNGSRHVAVALAQQCAQGLRIVVDAVVHTERLEPRLDERVLADGVVDDDYAAEGRRLVIIDYSVSEYPLVQARLKALRVDYGVNNNAEALSALLSERYGDVTAAVAEPDADDFDPISEALGVETFDA